MVAVDDDEDDERAATLRTATVDIWRVEMGLGRATMSRVEN